MADYPKSTTLWPGAEPMPKNSLPPGAEPMPGNCAIFCKTEDNKQPSYACSQCGASFDKPISLARHARTHK